ncbi:hypothetical protein HG535_0C04010 [Zygotorulaspora mrakii]|uniref:Protein BCP1 n=1 Tax=Zygotorulaspora mrakii TaxID=42260 RepID=A0A7H9B0P2_ZYGMR|nr:uncharacterized protein HG535_0C04010 [Zygotorulaspora mrakii]QLG72047.1 hypothetical protein HG535_0C04010 [Zygotorulaspora mrakii]
MVQAIKLSELTSRKRSANQELGSSEASDIDVSSGIDTSDSDDSDNDGDSNEEVVNIDFDFFNGDPNVDFHAFKNLLRQLFGPQESNRIQLSKLADLMLESPTTTIKTDGIESDPYCFLSIINYEEHRDCDYVKYLSKVDTRIQTFLQTVDANGAKSCALIVSERLINMPAEVVPPLYKITLEDVTKTLGDDKHHDFYIILSRKYEVNFDMDSDDDDDSDQNSKARSRKRVKQAEVDYFHVEDRHFEKNAKLKFQSEPRKGIINSYIILDHASLIKSIHELEQEIQTW